MGIKRVGAKGIYWADFRTSEGERVRKSLHTTDKKEARELEARMIWDARERIKRFRTGGPTRAEARLNLVCEEKVIQGGKATITLAEAFAHAMRVRDQWRSAKRPDNIHHVYRLIAEYFGEDVSLNALDDDAILKYGHELRFSGLSASTTNHRLCMISVLFDHAIEYRKFTGHKPLIKRYKVKNGRRRLVSPDEEALMLSLFLAHNTDTSRAMADLVTVLADTGMRLSEALGIRAVNINKDAKAVLILDTKNGDDRIVPLTERALEVLLRRNSTPMFHPLTPKAADYYWREARKKAGLAGEKEFVIHALRHTFASTLANAGVDAFRIQKVMGHKTIKTTEKYVKVSTKAVEGLSSIIEERTSKHTPSPSSEHDTGPISINQQTSATSTHYPKDHP